VAGFVRTKTDGDGVAYDYFVVGYRDKARMSQVYQRSVKLGPHPITPQDAYLRMVGECASLEIARQDLAASEGKAARGIAAIDRKYEAIRGRLTRLRPHVFRNTPGTADDHIRYKAKKVRVDAMARHVTEVERAQMATSPQFGRMGDAAVARRIGWDAASVRAARAVHRHPDLWWEYVDGDLPLRVAERLARRTASGARAGATPERPEAEDSPEAQAEADRARAVAAAVVENIRKVTGPAFAGLTPLQTSVSSGVPGVDANFVEMARVVGRHPDLLDKIRDRETTLEGAYRLAIRR
jgi:hypothetical protein